MEKNIIILNSHPRTRENVTQPGIPKERTERDGSPRKINYVR